MSTPYTPHLVANQRTAVDLSMDQWLTPQDAYEAIEDGYEYKGVVLKRAGYSWFDSVPHAIPGVGGATPDLFYQNVASITNGPASVVTLTANHGLADGDVVRFTDVAGLTATASGAIINKTRWTVKVTGLTTFTINNTDAFGGVYTAKTGTCSLMPWPGTSYLGVPIVGIANWVDAAGNTTLIVFDTLRMAFFDSTTGNNCLTPIGYADYFTGAETDLFWWENYLGYLVFTNNVNKVFTINNLAALPVVSERCAGPTARTINFDTAGTGTVEHCLMIKAVNNRLCLYNTTEKTTLGTNLQATRVRWCKELVDPFTVATAWDSVIPGNGGYADLTDSNYIISQGQLQYNNIIISQGFNYSVFYEQRPITGYTYPYVFVVIAKSKNVNSTFGTIVLDRQLNSIGNTGIITTDGNTVGRIDSRIPNFVIDNIDMDNFNRCFGIRNDSLWQTWTLYPEIGSQSGRNSNVLVFNYLDQAWSNYNFPGVESADRDYRISTLGLFFNPQPSPTWLSYGTDLPDYTWEDFDTETWNSLTQSQPPILYGGDYVGNLWWMDAGGGDAADNVKYGGNQDNGRPITMQLTTRQWFPFASEGKAAQFGFIDFLVDGDAETLVTVDFWVDNQNSAYLSSSFPCFPMDNLCPATISNATQAVVCKITAPDHGLVNGQVIYIFGVQGMYQLNNSSYAITVVDKNNFTIPVNSTAFNPYSSGGFISFSPIDESPFWTRVWTGQTGVFHQMVITASGVDETFALHAMIPWYRATGRIYRG